MDISNELGGVAIKTNKVWSFSIRNPHPGRLMCSVPTIYIRRVFQRSTKRAMGVFIPPGGHTWMEAYNVYGG